MATINEPQHKTVQCAWLRKGRRKPFEILIFSFESHRIFTVRRWKICRWFSDQTPSGHGERGEWLAKKCFSNNAKLNAHFHLFRFYGIFFSKIIYIRLYRVDANRCSKPCFAALSNVFDMFFLEMHFLHILHIVDRGSRPLFRSGAWFYKLAKAFNAESRAKMDRIRNDKI